MSTFLGMDSILELLLVKGIREVKVRPGYKCWRLHLALGHILKMILRQGLTSAWLT
jgi:hypothetical protein